MTDFYFFLIELLYRWKDICERNKFNNLKLDAVERLLFNENFILVWNSGKSDQFTFAKYVFEKCKGKNIEPKIKFECLRISVL